MDERLRYEFLERRVRGQACVDIFVLALPIPRYSFKVSSARVTYDSSGEKMGTTIPFLSTFSFEDASVLLLEVGKEFTHKRTAATEREAREMEFKRPRSPKRGGGRDER